MGTAVDVDFHQIDRLSTKSSLVHQELFCMIALSATSSETQGHIVGARESLNGRENEKKKNSKKIHIYVAPILFSAKRLKIWHEEKKRSARRAPGDNVLADQFQTVATVLSSDWAEKHKSFLAPIRSQNDGNSLEPIW